MNVSIIRIDNDLKLGIKLFIFKIYIKLHKLPRPLLEIQSTLLVIKIMKLN